MVLPKIIKKIVLFPILIVVLLVLSFLIIPMKTLTDLPRETMNCPNTSSFNQTAWNELSSAGHTIYSTGCYALHWDMLLFIGLLAALAIWGWFV